MRKRRWSDWVILAVGVWLFLAPFLLGFAFNPAGGALWAATDAWVVGPFIVAVAIGDIAYPWRGLQWFNAAAGAWLIAAPWLLGFADDPLLSRTHWVSGIVVVVLALVTLVADRASAPRRGDPAYAGTKPRRPRGGR
jgi:hypothetical protein